MRLDQIKARARTLWPYGNTTLFLVASLILLVANLCQYFLKPSGFPQGDSWAYAFGPEPSSALISLKGEALRKWPIVALNYALASDYIRMAAQTMISTAAWILMIRESLTFERNQKVSALLITCLAITPQIASWNSIQLSESYSISFGVMCIVFLRRYMRLGSNRYLFLLSLFLFVFLNTKPSNYLTFITLIFVSIPLLFSLNVRNFLKRNVKLTIITIIIVLYTALLTLNQSKQDLQTDGFGESYAAAQAVAVITNINPYSAQVNMELLKVSDYGCLGNVSDKSPIEVTELLKSKCSRTEEWLTSEFQRWYFSYIMAHPSYVIKLTAVSLAIGNSPYSMYGGSISVAPQFTSEIFFGSRNNALRLNGDSAQNIDISTLQVVSPLIIWVAMMVLLLILILNPRAKICTTVHRKSIRAAGIYCALFGAFSIAISAVSIPNEWFRQSIVGQVFVFLGVIQLTSCLKVSENSSQRSR